MERRHQCLLDKYCHIYKRIFILGGKSSHNIGLPSCILYVSRHHHKKKDQNCQNKHGVKQMLDWTKNARILSWLTLESVLLRSFWSRETWQFFGLATMPVFPVCNLKIRWDIDSYVNTCRTNNLFFSLDVFTCNKRL